MTICFSLALVPIPSSLPSQVESSGISTNAFEYNDKTWDKMNNITPGVTDKVIASYTTFP